MDTHEDAHQGTQGAPPAGSLSIQEAAIHFGVAEKTIRRRIKTALCEPSNTLSLRALNGVSTLRVPKTMDVSSLPMKAAIQ